MPRILISNDDGIAATGIVALARALEPLGEVWTVAPDREQSATSHAISLHSPLRMRELGERRFAVSGTPTDSVYLALHHVLPEPPDIVVSGINRGPNLGNDVLYSGTVSAAMEGALYGFPAVAVSLALPDKAADGYHFDTAATIAARVVRAVLTDGTPDGVVLNVNVPNRPLDDVAGIKLCRLGFTDWSDVVGVRTDPRGRPYYWIGGERLGHDDIEDSDNNGIAADYVTLTPIHYDLTDYRSFDWVRRLPVDSMSMDPDRLGSEPLAHPVHPRRRR